jgi:hypothetical protein
LIVGIVRCYNNASDLDGCLSSLKGKVDRIIVLDGFFAKPPLPKYHYEGYGASKDNPEEVCKRQGVEFVPAPKSFYPTEVDKLNKSLDFLQEGDWYLYIDPDELLMGNGLRQIIDYHKDGADIIPLRISEPNMMNQLTEMYGRERWFARLFRYRKGVHWQDNETVLQYPDGRVTLYMGQAPKYTYILHRKRD